MRVKVLAAGVTLNTTPNVVASGTDILIAHDAGGNASRTVSVYENDGTTLVGSYKSSPGTFLVILKRPDQKLKVDTGSDVVATSVDYLG